jgi:N-acetylated-alpha-linked acidic dipeptidase
MQHTFGRPMLGAFACALASAGTAAAQPSSTPLDGYTAANAARERAYEQRFQQSVNADSLGAANRALASYNRLDGSAGDQRGFQQSMAMLRSYGLQVRSSHYSVYLSKPRSIQVTMTAPTQRTLATIEDNGFPWQQDTQNIVVGYNAYSPSGDVTAPVVYANYGRPEDFAALEKMGVDVHGKIVLVRYGQNFRGVKAHLAEEHGAVGVIIYSDPEDDGFVKGPVYPNGPFRPADGIQRGSIQYLWEYPGDPLTPGEPSVPGTQRISPEQAQNLSHTPTTPISYREAEPLLRALGGPAAPDDFQGGLGFQYHVGPGPTSVHMQLDIDYGQAPLNDAFAVIPGREHPDQFVMLGGHQDAWTYGANDDLSGWSSVLEVGKRLGALMRQGWRPDRTIVLAGWDGEEYGLLGSTEWGEQFGDELKKDAVAYINMDGVSGRSFSGGGVPSIDKLMSDVTKTVSHPGGGTLFDNWRGEAAAPTPERLGSGSDYTVLLDHLGVPSMVVGMSTGGGEYHSAYDDTHQTETFLDPGYLGHQAASRTSGVLALRLANADALPLRYSDYAKQVDAYVAELQEIQRTNPSAAQVDLKPLRDAAASWGTASAALEAHAAELVSSDSPRSGQLRRVNNALMREERLLTTPVGIPGRPWFRHQVYAPGINTGYAAQFLPGIRDALDAGDVATVTTYRDLLLDSLRRATQVASRASGSAQAAAPKVRSTAKAAAEARRSARESAAQPAP